MKRVFSIILIGLVFLGASKVKANSYTSASQSDIASKLIRFHVIANSDSVEDQSLKLKVRDEVLKFISPKLSNSKSIDESRKLIKSYDKDIKNIAESVIKNNRYNYNVTTSLSNEYFPVKSYGNITLPQGKYEAYRIIIGEGKGKNWWCVMFPPLCFVDITIDDTSFKKIDGEMKQCLTPEEYQTVYNRPDDIKIKFKVVEIVKKVLNDLKR